MKRALNLFVATVIVQVFFQTPVSAQSIVDIASLQVEASVLEQEAARSLNADTAANFRATTARVTQLAGEVDALSHVTEALKAESKILLEDYAARTSNGTNVDAIIADTTTTDKMVRVSADFLAAATEQKKTEDALTIEYKSWQEQRAIIRSTPKKEEGVLGRAKRVAAESRERDPQTKEKLKRILKHGDSVGGSVAVEDVSTSGKG